MAKKQSKIKVINLQPQEKIYKELKSKHYLENS